MLSRGFELATPTTKSFQTYALPRTATRVVVIHSRKCCKKINNLSSSCFYPNRLILCSWLSRHLVRQKYSYAAPNLAMAVTYVYPSYAGNTSIVSSWVLRDEDLVGCFSCWMTWRIRNVTALSFGRDTAQCWIKFYLVLFWGGGGFLWTNTGPTP
jgi:hypothetical protein